MGLSTILGLVLAVRVFNAEPALPYKIGFESAELDKVPDEIAVLDGGFAVKEEAGNKFLELPGAPLDTYSALFGPTEKDGVVATCRVLSTSHGRRYPTFALGLNGAGGYRLQVSPAKKAIELFRNDTLRATAPWSWQSGKWTFLKIQVDKTPAGEQIKGKAWTEGTPEPSDWMITVEDKEALPAGRALLSASPFAETPIRFDDLSVAPVNAGSGAPP